MKVRIVLSVCAALIVIAIVACGGTSSTSPATNSASSGPSNAGTPPSSSNPGSSGSSSGSSGSSSGGSSGSGNSQAAVAYSYVGTTARSAPGVYGFAVAPDGTATPMPGSPVVGPSNDVVTNSAFVFGTDMQNIVSYERSTDGSLHQASTTYAVLSNGPEPWAVQAMSLDHTGQTLYAMENAGSDDLYYFFFSIDANGKITNLGKIGPHVDYMSALVFSPDNQYAYGYGCFHAGWDIAGFHRNSDGTLIYLGYGVTNNATGFPAYAGTGQMYCPVSEAISQNGYLAVGDTELGTNTSGLGSYKINADGSLSFVQNSTLATQLPSIHSMNFDRSGQFLAVTGNGGIQMYQLRPGGALTPIGGVQQPGPNYLAVQWDVDNHLYVTSSSGLYIFTNTRGVLTAVSGSPHAAGAAATLAVLPTH